jgi:hypothetical protein
MLGGWVDGWMNVKGMTDGQTWIYDDLYNELDI